MTKGRTLQDVRNGWGDSTGEMPERTAETVEDKSTRPPDKDWLGFNLQLTWGRHAPSIPRRNGPSVPAALAGGSD